MGWTGTHKDSGESLKEFFEGEFNHEKDGRCGTVLDCATKNNVSYLAYEVVENGSRKIVALICLLRYKNGDYYNVMYKDMDETMGIYEYNCPERILKLLTPTDNERANEWRKNCWKKIEKRKSRIKLSAGDIIEFDEPVKFTFCSQKQLTINSVKPLRLTDRWGSLYKLPLAYLDRVVKIYRNGTEIRNLHC